MKTTMTSLGLAFLLSTVAVIVVFVQVEAASSESEDVLAAERACAKAWVDADIATLDRFIADDYVEMWAEPVSEGAATHWKTQTKQQWLDLVRSRQEKYVSVEIRNEKVFLHRSCTQNCNLPDPPQPKLFNWVPADRETVRLDPDNYYTSRTYNPGPYGANIQVEIEAQRPVTIAMVDPTAWTAATEHPNASQNLNTIEYLCVQPHVMKTTYACKLPGFWPKVLILRDERNEVQDQHGSDDHAQGKDSRDGKGTAHMVPASASGASISGRDSARSFSSPNDIRIQYYSWSCVQSCDQPDFGWVRQVQEKYELTRILKVYGGITPDHDGAQVSVKVKSPVPMAVAILPSPIAAQLYSKPDMFDAAVGNSSCQQRGVQSSTFQCTLNMADGAQSLVVLPEAGTNVPSHKKAEIEVQVVKCIDNCASLTAK